MPADVAPTDPELGPVQLTVYFGVPPVIDTAAEPADPHEPFVPTTDMPTVELLDPILTT